MRNSTTPTTNEAEIRALRRRAVHDTKEINALARELGYRPFKLSQHKYWRRAKEAVADKAVAATDRAST